VIVGATVRGIGKHAMAAWKVEHEGHVFIYINNTAGTMDLNTSSENLDDIANAFNAKCSEQGSKWFLSDWKFLTKKT
jgi:hypothetical protein